MVEVARENIVDGYGSKLDNLRLAEASRFEGIDILLTRMTLRADKTQAGLKCFLLFGVVGVTPPCADDFLLSQPAHRANDTMRGGAILALILLSNGKSNFLLEFCLDGASGEFRVKHGDTTKHIRCIRHRFEDICHLTVFLPYFIEEFSGFACCRLRFN